MMARYKVLWEIDIDDDEASNAIEAAMLARRIQLDPENEANIYTVIDVEEQESYQVDLELVEI